MEWLDWAAIWSFAKAAFDVIAKIYSVFAVFVFLFWAVAMWRLIPRIDSLLLVESILSKREAKARKVAAETEPLPPRTYAENMADHERAMKRLSQGLDLNEG